MTDRKIPKISIGITSMTVILCVLCLTVFSVLALSTALSERKFSEKRAVAIQDYYTAETEAAALVNGLKEAWENGENLYAFSEKNEILTEGDIFRFYKSIDEGQKLYVELCLNDGFEIKKWQVVSTADWTPDESLHVWDGELLFAE